MTVLHSENVVVGNSVHDGLYFDFIPMLSTQGLHIMAMRCLGPFLDSCRNEESG